MSKTDELFPVVRDEIEFEKLLEQAQKALETYSGQYWTDRAEHDPGITLLEAMGYGVADLAYRQTRPLTDLLTPSPDEQVAGEGLFPAEFGPHQALTCGPISEADYRRALLDLHSTGDDSGYFFFRNARLVREPEAERYQYWYDPEYREYSFTEPATDVEPVRMTLLGNYHLYLLPSRETTQDPTAAQAALDDFLLNNRNLGESVSKIIWLQPEELAIELVVELEDNIGSNSNIAAILADIYLVAENYVTPAVSRYSTPELQAQGMRSEDINQGPWLQHGWIPQLPPPIDGTQPATVNLSGLVNALLEVAGVKSIRNLDATSNNSASSRWQWVASTPGVYPQLWGADPLTVLADGVTVQLLASGDVPLTAPKAEIEAELDKPVLIHNLPQVLPYGRWRNPGRCYPATDVVPPCYNLRVPATTTQQTQLHQFLLAFEQLLANGCQQQALLPALLAFKRQGDVVWGQQWPFADGSVSDNVHHTYRSALTTDLEQGSHNRDQELAITGFLLGYFNSLLAPDIFTQPADRFLASQQGFLSRQTELTYHRSNVRTDQVSSLQRRIAARLGLGGAEIFDDTTPLDELPFYLVEHRALMPLEPSALYDVPQTPVTAVESFINGHFLVLGCSDVSMLRAGQLIDILLGYTTPDVLRIRGQMVSQVDTVASTFTLDVSSSNLLERNLEEILSVLPENLAWQNSLVWLEDIDYPLTYTSDQNGIGANEYRLTCSPFPVMATAGDVLTLEYMLTPAAASRNTWSLTVVSVDRIANTLVVHNSNSTELPPLTKGFKWYFATSDYAVQDRFSLMTSVVFNQDLLLTLTSDPYSTEEWVREVILAEIPSHTGTLIHWKPAWEFNAVAAIYSRWQSHAMGMGDESYDLMYRLALGQLPDELLGIGSMYIATTDERDEVVGIDGTGWNDSAITENQLFFVPDVGTFELEVVTNYAVANGVDTNSVKASLKDPNGNVYPNMEVDFWADNGATIAASGTTGADGSVTVTLTSFTGGISTVTARFKGRVETVEVEFDAPLPINGTLEVNGHSFSTSSGFPTTGFTGSTFRLQFNDGDINDYNLRTDQQWVHVDSAGNVTFTGEATSETKTATIHLEAKDSSGSWYAWTFTLNSWFINHGVLGRTGMVPIPNAAALVTFYRQWLS
ncbi:Ig-like domain-containing protein [Serratia proteamaculans]